MSKLKVPQKPLKREINKKNTIDIQPVGIRYQRCFHLQKTIKKISIREKNCKKKNLNYAFACRGSRLAETVGFEPTSLRGIMISNVRQFWEKRVRGGRYFSVHLNRFSKKEKPVSGIFKMICIPVFLFSLQFCANLHQNFPE